MASAIVSATISVTVSATPNAIALRIWFGIGSLAAPTGSGLRDRRNRARVALQPGIFCNSAERSSAKRAEARSLTLSLFSWPQAAMMSRPRGVRTGEA